MITIDALVKFSKAFLAICFGIFLLAAAWSLVSMSSAATRYIDRSVPAETMNYGFTVDGQNKNLTIGVHGTLEHNVNDHPTESTSGWSEKDK